MAKMIKLKLKEKSQHKIETTPIMNALNKAQVITEWQVKISGHRRDYIPQSSKDMMCFS